MNLPSVEIIALSVGVIRFVRNVYQIAILEILKKAQFNVRGVYFPSKDVKIDILLWNVYQVMYKEI